MSETTTRIEHDTLGPVEVPADRLWGAQTQRSLEFFRISTERVPLPVIYALALIKKLAARVNQERAGLPAEKADAIVRAADEVLEGRHDQEFPLSVWQTGSGTQSNMNVNEVLANRASELLGGVRGEGRLVHANDDVNRSQSSNDTFPTAMSIAALQALTTGVRPELDALATVLEAKARDWQDIVKIGRTHLQDATPLTLGQEVGGWASQLRHGIAHLDAALPHLGELALGGTAVGTGLNAPRGWDETMARALAGATGLPLVTAPNKFEALSASDGLVQAHGALKGIAASLHTIANDVRYLASGPRAGLGELRLPANEPGSSIMPGKVNPTQCEALTMACAQVIGNDVAINVGGMSGQFQLNVYRPMMINAFLQSCRLIADATRSFREHCAVGMEPELGTLRANLEKSLMLVTALAPHIGYERAAEIAKKAHADGTSLKVAALTLGYVSEDAFDAWVRPDAMLGTSPG